MDFKPGEILVYRDRVYKKAWRVIALYRHEWPEYMVCYVIEAPPEDKEDLNTIMNIPAFFLNREGLGWPLNRTSAKQTI